MNKEIKKIFLILALFSFAGGATYNFQELWMASNNLSIKTISIVLSLCALISCSTIFICSNVIKQQMLQKFIIIMLVIKSIILFGLFFLNNSGLNVLIKFLIMMDYALDVEIYASLYPLISMVSKSNKTYAINGLIYDNVYYIAVVFVTILLGRRFLLLKFTYNIYLFLAAIILLIASTLLYFVDIKRYYQKPSEDNNNDLLIKLLKTIKKDKISIYYLLFSILGSMAFYIITGISMLILVNEINFSSKIASYILLGMGMSSALLGVLVLAKLTLNNNYINIGIKYIGRLIIYIMATIFTNKYTALLALLYTLLTASLYAHVTDAPYINRFKSDEQLAFANLKEMVGYFSRSLGVLFCGLLVVRGIKLNFILASVVVFFAIVFSYLALYNLNHEEVKKNDRK